MSFASGLVAGQRAAQGAIDAFTQSRERRNERRFNEEMAALEAERQERMQVPAPTGSGVLTPQAQQGIDTQLKPLAGTPGTGVLRPEFQNIGTVGLSQMPATPANPMSTSEYFQRQSALAGKHNLTDRAERYMTQGLQAQQYEAQEARYQRDADLQDKKFGLQQDQFKETQTQWDERFKLLQAQQATYDERIEQLIRASKAQMDEKARLQLETDIGVAAEAAYNRSFLDDDSNITEVLQNIPEKWAKDDVTKALYEKAILDKYMVNTGATIEQFSSVIGDARNQVASFMDGSKYEPGKHLEVVNEQLRFIIPDKDNNTTTYPIVEDYDDEEGNKKFRVRDGDVVFMDGMDSIEEIGAAYIEQLEENPWMEAININEAKKNRLAMRVRALDTEEEKRKAVLDMWEKNPHMFSSQKDVDQFLGRLGFDVGIDTTGWAANTQSRLRGIGNTQAEQRPPAAELGGLSRLRDSDQRRALEAQAAAERQARVDAEAATVTVAEVGRIMDIDTLSQIADSPAAAPEVREAVRDQLRMLSRTGQRAMLWSTQGEGLRGLFNK